MGKRDREGGRDRRKEGKIYMKCKDTRRTQPIESNKQDSQGLTETEEVVKEPAWVCTRSSAYTIWLLAWCFCGTPNSGSGVFLSLSSFLLGPFSLLGCLIPRLDMRLCA